MAAFHPPDIFPGYNVPMNISTDYRYSGLRRSLHWLSALVIIWALISGTCLAFFPLTADVQQWLGRFNVALTLLFIPFFLLRSVLAVRQQRLAATGHGLIYVVVLAVLFSGVFMLERPAPVFGLTELMPPLRTGAATAFFAALHHYSCALLALLVLGHIAAVIVHQRRGIRLLQKML